MHRSIEDDPSAKRELMHNSIEQTIHHPQNEMNSGELRDLSQLLQSLAVHGERICKMREPTREVNQKDEEGMFMKL